MKRLTPEQIDQYEWAKHEARHESERRAMEDDAIALGAIPAEVVDMSDADLLALVNRLEDEQEGGGEDPIAALLDDLPPPVAPDLGLLGETVRTEHGHGQVVMVRNRVVGGGWVTGVLVEDVDGRLLWASHVLNDDQEEAA